MFCTIPCYNFNNDNEHSCTWDIKATATLSGYVPSDLFSLRKTHILRSQLLSVTLFLTSEPGDLDVVICRVGALIYVPLSKFICFRNLSALLWVFSPSTIEMSHRDMRKAPFFNPGAPENHRRKPSLIKRKWVGQYLPLLQLLWSALLRVHILLHVTIMRAGRKAMTL